MLMELWTLESEILQSGVLSLCGVDEAGRGPLAGPVCAAAVILPHGIEIEGLNDSKKLSEKKREELFEIIIEKSDTSVELIRLLIFHLDNRVKFVSGFITKVE